MEQAKFPTGITIPILVIYLCACVERLSLSLSLSLSQINTFLIDQQGHTTWNHIAELHGTLLDLMLMLPQASAVIFTVESEGRTSH